MKRSVLTVLLLAAGVVCIGIGVCDSQHTAVLTKAIHICLECIGIG